MLHVVGIVAASSLDVRGSMSFVVVAPLKAVPWLVDRGAMVDFAELEKPVCKPRVLQPQGVRKLIASVVSIPGVQENLHSAQKWSFSKQVSDPLLQHIVVLQSAPSAEQLATARDPRNPTPTSCAESIHTRHAKKMIRQAIMVCPLS
jgi:hypothetical protein